MQGMKASRQEAGFAVPQDKVKVLGSFEIDLPDIRGRNIRLSSLTGKLVLLNFTAYQTEFSPSLNMTLGDLYTQYKERGFEIYQVSLDQDENFWKVSASNIPWVCVYDRNAQNSEFAAMYNVTQLPTLFLLNRQGEIVKRVTNISTLKSELAKLL
jgi:glutathione peroxidase-family protein